MADLTHEVDAVCADYYTISKPDVFTANSSTSDSEVTSKRAANSEAKKQLLAKLMLECFELDRYRAPMLMQQIEKFGGYQGKPRATNQSWTELVQNRSKDVGMEYVTDRQNFSTLHDWPIDSQTYVWARDLRIEP